MHYQWDFPFLLRYAPLFWKGVLVTLAYTAGTIFLGLILGLLIGLGRLARAEPDRAVGDPGQILADLAGVLGCSRCNGCLIAFVEAFRCTPLLVQIVWVYYALPVVLGVQIPATVAAIMTLSLLHRRVLRGDIPRRHHVDRARPMGRRPSARACGPGP